MTRDDILFWISMGLAGAGIPILCVVVGFVAAAV